MNTSIESKITVVIETLDAMPIASQGVKRSLSAQLQAALRIMKNNDRPAAKNILEAFKNATTAKRGNGLSDAQADSLIAAANNIIALL